jgi:hypothetical protein
MDYFTSPISLLQVEVIYTYGISEEGIPHGKETGKRQTPHAAMDSDFLYEALFSE